LACEMGYSRVLIANYENDKCPVSDDVLLAFRTATNTAGVPMRDHELVEAQRKLYDWYNLIVIGKIERAEELYDEIVYTVQWSYDTDLRNMFEIYCTLFHHTLGDMDERDRIVNALKQREDELTSRQLYFFYHALGIFEYFKWRYKTALSFLLKAETIGRRLGISSKPLHHIIGSCLAHMGYFDLAIKHLKKSRSNELVAGFMRYHELTHKLLAICHSKLGRVDKALMLLNGYHEYLIFENKCSTAEFFVLHINLATVYEEAGDFEKAQENYDIAFKHYNEKDELYLAYTCDKAMFLRGNSNRTKKTFECVNEGLSLAAKDTLWYEWLNAIKHSLTLSSKTSEDYIQWTAIPKLTEYGKHYEVMKLYTWLSDHYTDVKKYKLALGCTKAAFAIYSRLMKGDLSL